MAVLLLPNSANAPSPVPVSVPDVLAKSLLPATAAEPSFSPLMLPKVYAVSPLPAVRLRADKVAVAGEAPELPPRGAIGAVVAEVVGGVIAAGTVLSALR